MKIIVLATINGMRETRDLDRQIVAALTRILSAGKLDAAVYHASSFEQIEQAFASGEPTALVTNFPPDSTYTNTSEPELRPGFGGFVYSSAADSYTRSRSLFASIFNLNPSLRTLVLTGAPRNRLTDEEIIGIAKSRAVRVIRKADLIQLPGGYPSSYSSLAIDFVARAVKADDNMRQWQSVQMECSREQLGQLRVLVMHRKKRLAESLCHGLVLSCVNRRTCL